jgi:hypothetical protein
VAARLVFFSALFLLTSAGFDTSEGVYHYQVSQQIVRHGELGFPGPPPDPVFFQAPNGRSYAAHEIGNSLLLLPVAIVSKVVFRGVAPEIASRAEDFLVAVHAALYMALCATFFGGILVEFSLSRREAFWTTLAVFTTSYLWTYSRNLFDGVAAGMFLTASFWFLLRQRVVVAFVLLGFAVITRTTCVLAVLASLVYLTQGRRWREIRTAILVLLPFAAWQLYYNHLRSGHWLIGAIHTSRYNGVQSISGFFGDSLPGLLFSPGKSVFVFAPLLVFSVLGFRQFWRAHRAAALYVAVLGGSWLLTHALLKNWQGSWGWGPRYFVTILPILSVPGALVLPSWWKERRWFVMLFGGFGFVLSLSSILSNWHFRMGLAAWERRLGAMDWSLARGQAVDMLRAGAHNVLVILGQRPVVRIPGESEANAWASNTVNLWEFSFAHAGISKVAILAAVIPILAALVWSGRRLQAPIA